MSIVFRQSIKTSIVIFTGAVIGIAFTYWQTLIMPQQMIGISRILITQAVVFQSLLLFGAHSVSHTYVQRYAEQDPKRGTVLGTSLLVPFLAVLLFCIPYFSLREWIVSKYQVIDQVYINRFFSWLPLLVLVWTYMTLLEAYLVARMKVALATFMREVVLRLSNMVLLVLFALGWISFDYFIIGTVLSYCIPVIALAVVAARETKVKLSLNWSLFNKAERKDIVHYAWYHAFIGSTLNIVSFVDSLMLAPLDKSGSSALAVYGIAIFLIGFVNIPFRAMTAAAFPRLNQIYLEGRHDYLVSFFNRTNLNILVATVCTGMLIWCNVHNAVALLPAGYEALAPLFGILLLGRLIDVSTGLNQEFIGITPYYKFNFWASLIYIIVAVIGNRIFIPVYGVYGAAWVSAASLALYNIIKAVFLKWKFGLYPFELKGLWVFFIGLAGYATSLLLPRLANPFADGLMRTPIVLLVMIVLLLWIKPSSDVKEYWNMIRRNKRLF